MPATTFRNLDPGKYILVFNGVQLTGFQNGTFISVERKTDTFSDEAGGQGDVVRVRSRDKRGTVTVTLQGASSSNDVLSTFAATDEAAGTAYGPLLVKDLNGTSIYQGTNAYIAKYPKNDLGDTHTPREWVIAVPNLDMFTGGFVS